MKIEKRFCSVAVVLFSVLISVACADPTFTTIRDAIAAANPGDVVYVPAGTYHEEIVLKRGMILIGEGADSTIIDGGGSVNAVRAAKESAVAGFTIRNSDFAVYSEGCFMGVFDCKLLDNDCAVGFNGGTGIVDGNVIAGKGKQGGIRCYKANPLVINNIISDDLIGLFLTENYVSTVTSNIFADNKIGIKIEKDAAAILNGNVFDGNKKDIIGQEFSENDVTSDSGLDSPYDIEIPVRDAEVYRGLMAAVFETVTAEHPLVVYNLLDEGAGRFGCSTFFPWATFHVKVSAKDTAIEDFGAIDRLTEDALKAHYFKKDNWPSVRVKNPAIKQSDLDRYLLDQVYFRPHSYFANDAEQLVFDRLTSFTRIEIAVPEGYVPVSVSHPFETESVNGRVIVSIVDVGKTHVKVIMEKAAAGG